MIVTCVYSKGQPWMALVRRELPFSTHKRVGEGRGEGPAQCRCKGRPAQPRTVISRPRPSWRAQPRADRGKGAVYFSPDRPHGGRRRNSVALTSWGAGTRRLAALAVAEANHAEKSIVVVDEVERGLEPYRQRTLMDQLRASGSQAFVTTHSPFALAAGEDAVLWHMDLKGSLGPLTVRPFPGSVKPPPKHFFHASQSLLKGTRKLAS